MLRVASSYRGPIENLCANFDIELGEWPRLEHPEYRSKLATMLDRVFEDVRHKFQQERAYWLEKFRVSLEAAGDDVRALEGTLDSNYRLGKHVEQHFKDLDGEGGLIEKFIFYQKTSRSVIEAQQKRIIEVTQRLAETSALADQLMLAIRANEYFERKLDELRAGIDSAVQKTRTQRKSHLVPEWDGDTRLAAVSHAGISDEYWRLQKESVSRITDALRDSNSYRQQAQFKKPAASSGSSGIAIPPTYTPYAQQAQFKKPAASSVSPSMAHLAPYSQRAQSKKPATSSGLFGRAIPPSYTPIKPAASESDAGKATGKAKSTGASGPKVGISTDQQPASPSRPERQLDVRLAVPPVYQPPTQRRHPAQVQSSNRLAELATIGREVSETRRSANGRPHQQATADPTPEKGLVTQLPIRWAQPTVQSAPGLIQRLEPPSSSDKTTLATLAVEPWTRWKPEERARVLQAKDANDVFIIQHHGTEKANASCLDPSMYGGTTEFNLGFCADWAMKGYCEFDSWELCPLRHWKPDEMERRWMKVSFLKNHMLHLNELPLPPDNMHARYNGRPRQYASGEWYRPRPFVDAGPGVEKWQKYALSNQMRETPATQQNVVDVKSTKSQVTG
ncbi:hypothetical protein N0V95_009781 [Ascochyta clinopodiicola]|nr:hypothetical protein N0V95_009781 [Ascochyta clinopodiicola]